MSNSFMRSSYFQTQVNNANIIKNCYPCGSNCTVISGGCNCSIPTDLTLSTLTVNGLIEASGLQFNPVLINPGDNPATTIWANAMDMNKLYYGAAAVGGGGVASVTGGTNISTSGTATDPVINFNPGGIMNMNRAQLTNVSSMSVSSINAILQLENGGGKGGSIIASQTGNIFAIQAQGGHTLLMESDGGIINIPTTSKDTTATISVNGETASLILTDTDNVGTMELKASTITIKNNDGTDPVLRFDNPSATGYENIDLIYQSSGNYDSSGSALLANCLEMGIAEGGSNTGALRIGTTTTENYVYGGGYPLRIKQSAGDNKEIRFDVNPSQQISINVDTGNLNLQGTNITAGSSSGSSGTFLIINVNGTPYKLDLHNI